MRFDIKIITFQTFIWAEEQCCVILTEYNIFLSFFYKNEIFSKKCWKKASISAVLKKVSCASQRSTKGPRCMSPLCFGLFMSSETKRGTWEIYKSRVKRVTIPRVPCWGIVEKVKGGLYERIIYDVICSSAQTSAGHKYFWGILLALCLVKRIHSSFVRNMFILILVFESVQEKDRLG